MLFTSHFSALLRCSLLAAFSQRQEWLHVLKDTLENLPSCSVTEESLGLEGIRLANHVPGKPVALDFQPPEVCYKRARYTASMVPCVFTDCCTCYKVFHVLTSLSCTMW